MFISKTEPYGKKVSLKYFIAYEEHSYIRPLCIKLPQMIGYVKCFGNTKKMCFKIAD